jgi:hypothetical protein
MSVRTQFRNIRKLVNYLSEALLPAKPRNFEEQIFAAFVKPGDVVYDVGANIGLTASFLRDWQEEGAGDGIRTGRSQLPFNC